jgi:predicted porin
MRVQLKMLAVAVASMSSATFAQSSVQIYGLADAGVVYANRVRAAGPGSPESSMLRMDSGNAASSRLGFRGRESLGAGLSAVFVLESGINLDVGTLANGGRAFGRSSYVGLASSEFGELQLGRQITGMYDFALVFDPVAPARFSTPVFDAAYVGRADNAVRYVGKFGGFNIKSQYSLGYDGLIANGGEQSNSRIGKQIGTHVDYTIGAFTMGIAYDRQNGSSVATARDKNVHVNVGFAWDIKPVKVYAAYSRRTVDAAGRSAETKFYWLAAHYRPTPLIGLTAGVYVFDPEGASNRSVMPTILATYDLSKRTDLYTQIGHLRNQSNAAVGMVGSVNPGKNQTAVTLGIRHRF